ncbi:hypothetical protein GCM10010517_58570 [Streptosporangium fragile]|uniref:ClpX-type ZB domain-containing protein n=1 Tax=Streptosporangium fragile TaxID=46186 RepID=A0ABN3W5J1_9ACTN
MPAPSLADQEIYCSFCTKSKTDVDKMIAGAGVHICNECVQLCNIILSTPTEPRRPPRFPGRTA